MPGYSLMLLNARFLEVETKKISEVKRKTNDNKPKATMSQVWYTVDSIFQFFEMGVLYLGLLFISLDLRGSIGQGEVLIFFWF